MAKAKAKASKVPVSERALIQRINRVLRRDDEQLKAVRGARARMDLGFYFILNYRTRLPGETHVNLENLGRELKVLQPWEAVAWNDDEA